jgi:branched-chain amino acid transport system ATP-binding protein
VTEGSTSGEPVSAGADAAILAEHERQIAARARQRMDQVPAQAGVDKPDALLRVEGLHQSFGGLVAVDTEHLKVQRGTITALIGPNGAGKTTLFNVLTGFQRPDRGRWEFDGHDISGDAPYRIAQRGMVRTFQLTRALTRMTVLDNLRLAGTGQSGERLWSALMPFRWRSQEQKLTQKSAQLLQRFELSGVAEDYAGELSGGQRKLLEMARALMVRPRLLMLDEPVAGVNPTLKESLLAHITGLRDEGMTVVFVEHDMDVVMGISDWVVCMAAGQVIAEGPPQAVGENQAVVDAYLGARRDQRADGAPP